MIKLKSLIKESSIELGKIYTDKDKPPFKTNVNEKSNNSNQIQVRGIGVYPYDTLKKKVHEMAKDLAKNAKKGTWRKSSRNGIRAFAEMWNALTEYERRN